MLRLSRNRLHIGISPHYVAWLRYAGRGKSRVTEKAVRSCDPSTLSQPWQPALAVLSAWLSEGIASGASATVVLSDTLVRYTLVPPNDKLSGREEELAYARHHFELVHGRAVDDWELRISPAAVREPRVASAVDRALLDALRQTFAAARVPLDSIQPLLMAAFNRGRRYVDGAPALFITAEGEHYTCAGFDESHWKSVRTGRLAGHRGELGAVLDREWLWLGSESRPDVTLFYAGDAEPELAVDESWNVSALKVQPAGFSAAEERLYALPLAIA